jgi:hypothetical protein
MNQLRPELDNVLQCLSLNGYSVLSLIDDIHARCNLNRENERIKTLREGMERDTADICARLLYRITSSPATVLKFGKFQCTCSSSDMGSHETDWWCTPSATAVMLVMLGAAKSRSYTNMWNREQPSLGGSFLAFLFPLMI